MTIKQIEGFSKNTLLESKEEKLIISTMEVFNVFYTHVYRYLKDDIVKFQLLDYSRVTLCPDKAKIMHEKVIKEVKKDMNYQEEKNVNR